MKGNLKERAFFMKLDVKSKRREFDGNIAD